MMTSMPLSPSLIGTVAVLAVLLWALADIKSILRLDQRRARLNLEGRWEELNDLYEASLRTWRPFVRIFRASLTPGIVEALYASHLFLQGKLEKALPLAERAVARSRRSARIRRVALATQVQILTGLGRYDDACAVANGASRLQSEPPLVEMVVALAELYRGRLEESLSRVQPCLTDPRTTDSARLTASAVHRLRGEFREAIAVLLYSPADIAVFYSPDQYQKVTRVPDGARLVELLREERKGVVLPAPYLAAADAYIDQEDWNGVTYALGRAESLLGSNPAVQRVYQGLKANLCAGQGDGATAERHLDSARELVKRFGSRSWTFETRMRSGRSYLLLGRFEDALGELGQAEKIALHPVEKHAVRYWFGRALEAAGRRGEAVARYREVVADRFGTWIERDATARLSSATSSPPA